MMTLARSLLLCGLLGLPGLLVASPEAPAACDASSRERLTPYRTELARRGWLRDAKIDGYRYTFAVAGESGPVLVLLHGLGGSLYDWRHVLAKLAEEHRVVAPDLLGAGESDKPSAADYGIVAQARRVKGLLDRLGIERATLVGSSYGGGVALAFAEYWPERVERLVLIDSIGYAEDIPIYVDLSRIPFAEEAVKLLPVEEVTARALRGAFKNADALGDEELATYVKELDPPARRVTVVQTLRALVPGDLTEFHARLRAIDAESLVLWGKDDEVIPIALGRRLARDLPRAHLVELDAGHVPNQECPDEVLAHLRRFLE